MRGPLVLLHGFAGAPAAWDEVSLHLRSRRVVRPALVGHDAGRLDAELARPPASFADAVDALAAELRAAGVSGDADLCGYSLGGRMALGLLARHPALFGRATLIGVHPGLGDGDRTARAAADERWAALADQGDLGRFLAAWEDQALFATQRRRPEAALEAQRRWRSALRPEGLALSLRSVGLARMPSYWAELPAIDIPVRLVAGEEDPKFRALAERAAEALPRCRLSVIPACGHNALLESPASVAALLSEE